MILLLLGSQFHPSLGVLNHGRPVALVACGPHRTLRGRRPVAWSSPLFTTTKLSQSSWCEQCSCAMHACSSLPPLRHFDMLHVSFFSIRISGSTRPCCLMETRQEKRGVLSSSRLAAYSTGGHTRDVSTVRCVYVHTDTIACCRHVVHKQPLLRSSTVDEP